MVLWAYRRTPKKLKKHTPFNLVYNKEVVVLVKFMIPNLFIAQATRMLEECLESYKCMIILKFLQFGLPLSLTDKRS